MKLLKLLAIIFSSLIIVALLVIAYLFFSIRSNTDQTKDFVKSDQRSFEVISNEYLYKSLNNLENSNTISYLLNEDDLDLLLYKASQKINTGDTIKIKSIYSKLNSDNTISIYAPVKVWRIKSNLSMRFEVKKIDDGNEIYIKNISIGKLKSNGLFGRIALNKLYKPLSNNKYNIDVKKHKSGLKITVKNDDLIKIINDYLDSQYSKLYEAILKECFNNEIIDLNFNRDLKVGVNLKLDNLISDVNLAYNLETASKNLDYIKEQMKVLINEKKIEYKDISVVFDYLVRGYNYIKEENKTIINSIDFSVININNKESYEGIVIRDNILIDDVINDNINSLSESDITSILLNRKFDVKINENTLNKMLNSSDFIGQSFAVYSDNDLAYITVAGLFVKIYNDRLLFNFTLDINKKMVNMTLDFSKDDDSNYALKLKVNKGSIGNIDVSNDTLNNVLILLNDIVSNDSKLGFIKVDPSTKNVTFDFSNKFNNSRFKTIISILTNNEILLSDNDMIIRFYR